MPENEQTTPHEIMSDDEMEEDDREWYRELLESKIAEAEAAGKEPFSAEAFDRYYTRFDISDSSTKIANNPERISNTLSKYYIRYPDVMTVEEFAEKLMELDSYGSN